jgi:hypothetical protein
MMVRSFPDNENAPGCIPPEASRPVAAPFERVSAPNVAWLIYSIFRAPPQEIVDGAERM